MSLRLLNVVNVQVEAYRILGRLSEETLADFRGVYWATFLKVTAAAIVFKHVTLFIVGDAIRNSLDLSHRLFFGIEFVFVHNGGLVDNSWILVQIDSVSEVLDGQYLMVWKLWLLHQIERMVLHHVVHLIGRLVRSQPASL